MCAEIATPFTKVCGIVQVKNMQMYGTAFIAKSLCYVSELLGTKPYYGVDGVVDILEYQCRGRASASILPVIRSGSTRHHSHVLNIDAL